MISAAARNRANCMPAMQRTLGCGRGPAVRRCSRCATTALRQVHHLSFRDVAAGSSSGRNGAPSGQDPAAAPLNEDDDAPPIAAAASRASLDAAAVTPAAPLMTGLLPSTAAAPAAADAAGSDPSALPAAEPAGARHPTAREAFAPSWPYNYKKRLEAVTLERAHEADVTPTVFDFALWRRHRSRLRYVEHLVNLASSYFVLDLAAPVAALMFIAAAVGLYETGLQAGALPSFLPNIAMAAEGPFNAASFAMSLMLAFKTNVSYARWNEARCLWGSLVNRSRNLVRQGLMLIPREHAALKPVLARWSIAFARALKAHLREDGDVTSELQHILEPHEVAVVSSHYNRPLACLQAMSNIIRAADLDPMTTSRLDINLEVFEDIMGACERILKTPVPLSYTRHTSRFLTLWLATLPFVLWNHIGWGVVPSTGVIAFLLFGIDEIAIQLEEPFGILPLEAICETVQRNIEELVKSEGTVNTALDASFSASRARVAQEEELAAMLEQQLPFSWGPRELEPREGDAWVGGNPAGGQAAAMPVAPAPLGPVRGPGGVQVSTGAAGGSGGGYHHHWSLHPETPVVPWRPAVVEAPLPVTAPPAASADPAASLPAGNLPRWPAAAAAAGSKASAWHRCPPGCSCNAAEPVSLRPDGRPVSLRRDRPRALLAEVLLLRRQMMSRGGDGGAVAVGMSGSNSGSSSRGSSSRSSGGGGTPGALPLEPLELPWYAGELAPEDLASAAGASGADTDLHSFLLGRAHGAIAVAHPGTPLGTLDEEIPPAAASEEAPAAPAEEQQQQQQQQQQQ